MLPVKLAVPANLLPVKSAYFAKVLLVKLAVPANLLPVKSIRG